MITSANYRITRDDRNPRIKALLIDIDRLSGFVEYCIKHDSASRLAIPAERFRLAERLESQIDRETVDCIHGILRKREEAAMTLKLPPAFATREVIECFIVALGHLLGMPRCDANNDPLAYLESTVGNSFLNVDSKRTLPIHTDGTYYDGATDWIILFLLENTIRTEGEALLLHIDDWLPYTEIATDKMFRYAFSFKGPSSSDTRKHILGKRNDLGAMVRPMFFDHQLYGLSARVAHQWIHPQNFEEARFINRIIDSLASFEQSARFALEQNEMYIINNNIWLHGRYKSDQEASVKRIALRCFGKFHSFDNLSENKFGIIPSSVN